MEKRKELFAELGMLMITVLWGYGFIATKIAAENYTATQIVLYRFVIAAIILPIVFWKDLKAISKKDAINGAVLGIILFLGFFLQTTAINYTTVAKNAFLTTLNVIFVPLIAAVVYKERVDKFSVLGCVIALVGTGILSLNLDMTVNLGDILSIACAIFFSFHIFFQSIFVRETKPSVLAAVQFIVSAVLSLIFALIIGEAKTTVFHLGGVIGIVYLGVFSTSFCILMQAVCQKYTSPVKAVVIFSLEAVFASIFAIILLGDAVTPRFLIGSGTIFAAVIISTTKLSFFNKAEDNAKIIDKSEPIG